MGAGLAVVAAFGVAISLFCSMRGDSLERSYHKHRLTEDDHKRLQEEIRNESKTEGESSGN